MDYTTVTYNGITKIADCNIYLDPAKKPICYQWFLPQLQEIAKIMDIKIKDELTGLYYGKKTLATLIKEVDPLSLPKITESNLLHKLGLIPSKKNSKNNWTNLTYPNTELIYTPKSCNISNWDLLEFIEKEDYFLSEEFPKSNSLGKIKFKLPEPDFSKVPVRKTVTTKKSVDTIDYLVDKMTSHSFILPELGRFYWKSNSCYADSALFALLNKLFKSDGQFTLHPVFTQEVIEKNYDDVSNYPNLNSCKYDTETTLETLAKLKSIHDQFSEIVSQLSSTTPKDKFMTLQAFRASLKTCSKKSTEKYWTNKTQDSGEFLFNLFDMLQIDVYQYSQLHKVFTNSDESEENSEDASLTYKPTPILHDTSHKIVRKVINRGLLQNLGEINSLSQFIDYTDRQEVNYLHIDEGWHDQIHQGTKHIVNNADNSSILTVDEALAQNIATNYKYMTEKTLITTAGLLFFQVDRKGVRDALDETKIIPDDTLLLEDCELFLFSIVCYVGNHYICLFKYDDDWYCYNDMNMTKGYIDRIGSYESMLLYAYEGSIKEVASTRGTLYYYG